MSKETKRATSIELPEELYIAIQLVKISTGESLADQIANSLRSTIPERVIDQAREQIKYNHKQ